MGVLGDIEGLTTGDALEAACEILRRQLVPQTFGQWLRARLDEACDAFDKDPQHACSPHEFAMSCGKCILEVLRCDDHALRDRFAPLCHAGAVECVGMMKRLAYRYRERLARRPYRTQSCGDLPYRDHAHGALRVLGASELSQPSGSKRVYPYALAEPFVDHRVRKRLRAGLYHRRLLARRLGPGDIKTPDERSLIGQWGVFATTPIAAGSCLGVYGGLLMRKADAAMLGNWEHVLWMPSGDDLDGERVWVNGENIMSLINTFVRVDAEGGFLGHPDADYNVEPARFRASLSHGWEAGVVGIFALRDIAPAEELRWNYGWAVAPAGWAGPRPVAPPPSCAAG